MRLGLVLAALLTLVLTFEAGVPRTAGAEAALVSQGVENGFPTSLTFRVEVEAPGGVAEATLSYSVAGSGSGGFNRPESIPAGDRVTIELELNTNTRASYIPVGSLFRYSWEVEAADGSILTTPEEEFLYLPPNRDWKVAASDVMEVWYHGDRDGTANQYLQAANETYEEFAALLGADLRVLPVRVVLFATESEMDPAKAGMGGGIRDEQITVCGQQVSPVVVFVLAGTCGTSDITDTLRHELVHIIVEEAQGLIQIPLWLNEGLAVSGQTEPGSGFVGPFQAAVRTDRLLPFVQMSRPAANPNQTGLYYGQSWAMTQYLLERYGPGAMGDLFAALRSGTRFDAAFEQVFGVNLAGFEDEFRESLGLAPATAPTVAPTQAPGRPEAPTPTFAAPPQQSGSSNGGSDISPVFLGSLAIAAFLGLLAVFFMLLMMMARNSSRAAPATATGGGQAPSAGPAAEAPRAVAEDAPPLAAVPPPGAANPRPDEATPPAPERGQRPPPAWRPMEVPSPEEPGGDRPEAGGQPPKDQDAG